LIRKRNNQVAHDYLIFISSRLHGQRVGRPTDLPTNPDILLAIVKN